MCVGHVWAVVVVLRSVVYSSPHLRVSMYVRVRTCFSFFFGGGGRDPPGLLLWNLVSYYCTAVFFRWSRLGFYFVVFFRCTTKHESCSEDGATRPSSTPRCGAMMDSLVYLPLANNVPDSEVDRWGLVYRRASQDRSELIPCRCFYVHMCLRAPGGNSFGRRYIPCCVGFLCLLGHLMRHVNNNRHATNTFRFALW